MGVGRLDQVLISAAKWWPKPVTDCLTLLDGRRAAEQRKISGLLPELVVQKTYWGRHIYQTTELSKSLNV